ncbi:hypothetical protein TNCV_11481 [Trichonephila clavipes]|nr:hypothetical protein TNCV_11481 [Trichonephila clavipes]
MLVRLSRAPVLSGGLRRKTQLFSGTLYMAASSKTHLTSPRSSEVQHPALSASFPRAVRCVIIPIVKTHQTQLHSTQSWSATGLRGRKK